MSTGLGLSTSLSAQGACGGGVCFDSSLLGVHDKDFFSVGRDIQLVIVHPLGIKPDPDENTMCIPYTVLLPSYLQ